MNLSKLDAHCDVARHETSFTERLWQRIQASPGELIRSVLRISNLIALYLPSSRQIWLNKDSEPMARRWGHAHELGHAVLEHSAHGLYYLERSADNEDPLGVAQFADAEEDEANYFASCLLFPRRAWTRRFDSASSWVAQVPSLARYFKVSTMATVRHIVSQSSTMSCVIALPRRYEVGPNGSPLLSGMGSVIWRDHVDPDAFERLITELLTLRGGVGRVPEEAYVCCRDDQLEPLRIETMVCQRHVLALCRGRRDGLF